VDESSQDLARLQKLLDDSFARASEHLVSIMTGERRIPADRLATMLPSPAVLNVATVTRSGEPRLSAVDGHFLRGHWYWTTAAASPKARQLAARPAVSASYTPRDGFGVFCHGTAALLGAGAERDRLAARFHEVYGQSFDDWGVDIAAFRIDARWMVAFAMTDEEMAAIEAERAERAARGTG
jgi:hypothetical protein